MRPPLDQWAGYLATWLVGWLVGRAEPEERVWVVALWGDMDAIERGWDRLRWAMGGIPLAWRLRRPHHASHGNHSWDPWTWRWMTRSVVLDVLFAAAFMIAVSAWRRPNWWAQPLTLGAALLATVLALALHRTGTALITAGVLVMAAIWRAQWWVLSGDVAIESQYAFFPFGGVPMALSVGLMLGALSGLGVDGDTGDRRRLRTLLHHVQRVAVAAGQRLALSSHALGVAVAFLVGIVVNDLVFPARYQRSEDFMAPVMRLMGTTSVPWQDRHYLLGGAHLTLLAALLGVALGVLITSHGHRLALWRRMMPARAAATASAAASAALVRVCAWCHRTCVDGAWIDGEDWARRQAMDAGASYARLTHGICDRCVATLERETERQPSMLWE